MKNLIIFAFFIMLLVFAQFAQGQTVDDIVDKYIGALGGKEKLLALKSVRLTGSMNVQGNDINITITKLHQKGMRVDFLVAGTENYQVITPEKGISFMPVQGMTSPSDMSEDQFKSGQIQLDVQSAFLNYQEKGTKIELLGTETIAGADNYKLKLTYKNGIVVTYYIGKSDYRINKTESKRNINGEEMNVETTFSNYKQNADGYWFPYATSGIQGDTFYDTIETNIAVDENIFK